MYIYGVMRKKKFNEYVKRLTDAVSDARKEIIESVKRLDPALVNSSFVEVTLLQLRYCADYWPFYGMESFEERISRVEEIKTDFMAELPTYYRKATENKVKLEKLYRDGVPMFIKMTKLCPLFNDKVTYAMCYEYKRYDNGKYKAYVFTDTETDGKVIEFEYWDYSVEEMTEDEFELYYIIGRLNVVSYRTEEEAIEYDNYVRRLFHGQRKITD